MRIASLAGLLAISLISSGLIPLPARAAIGAIPFDFDGNGYADLATGVPGESVGSVRQAGAVEVIYASADGLSATGAQLWSRASPGVDGEPTKGEQFGRTLTSADVDRDGYADLAALTCNQIGILHGSPTGLTSRSVFLTTPQSDPPPCTTFEPPGLSGVVTGDFNGDSRIDLVAGSSGSNRVFVYPGTDTGFSPTPALDFAKEPPTRKGQEVLDVGNALAAGDITGDGIDDLVAGTGLGQIDSTGTGTSSIGGFYFVPGSSSGLQPDRRNFVRSYGNKGLRPKKAQLSGAFGHALVIADFDHDGFGDVAVGDPEGGFDGEDCDSGPCSGAVLILPGSANGPTARGRQFWSLSAQRPWDGDEEVPEGNSFGARLAAGDLNRDGHLDLAIATPNDQSHYRSPEPRDVGPGNVYVLYGTSRGLSRTGLQIWSQRTPGVVGVAKPWEQFGVGGLQILEAGRGRAADLLIHNPRDRTRRGSVSVLYGSTGGLRARYCQLWHQNTPGVPGHGEHPPTDDGVRTGDQFGTTGPPDFWL